MEGERLFFKLRGIKKRNRLKFGHLRELCDYRARFIQYLTDQDLFYSASYETIDLIEIYGAPQESYDLSYYFDINRNEIGERFTVKVTVTDVH